MPIDEPQEIVVTMGVATSAVPQEERIVTQPRYALIDRQTNTVTLMSSRDLVVAPKPSARAEQKFRALAEQWYTDTLFSSAYLDKILHPAYQKILTLGEDAIPLILRELRDMPNDWFWALRVLSDEDPAASERAGDINAIAGAWLMWGEKKGYIR